MGAGKAKEESEGGSTSTSSAAVTLSARGAVPLALRVRCPGVLSTGARKALGLKTAVSSC